MPNYIDLAMWDKIWKKWGGLIMKGGISIKVFSLILVLVFLGWHSRLYSQYLLDIEWISVPAGKFLYGSRGDTVSVDYDYSISTTEVTNGQYLKFLNDAIKDGAIRVLGNRVVGNYSGDKTKESEEYTFIYFEENSDYQDIIRFNGRMFLLRGSNKWKNHPVRFVTWFGANAFAEYYGMSLPTNKEWEKAARGLDSTEYPWGDLLFPKFANYHDSGDPFDNGTAPVKFYDGNFKDNFDTGDNSSVYGVYDMIGNVSEWTESYSDHYPEYFVFRGGSWRNKKDDLLSYQIKEGGPELATSYLGFRCVKR